MPTLETFTQDKPVKLLYMASSGAGKTGALAALVIAGFKLRILDFDDGLTALSEALKAAGHADLLKNVEYVTLRDDKKTIVIGDKVKIVPSGTPSAFARGLQLLDHWKYKVNGVETDLGRPDTWGRDVVLVVDTLDFAGMAAMDRVLAMNNRSGEPPQIQDYGLAMSQLEQTVQRLCSPSLNCHVVVNTHITFIGEEGQIQKGYPGALGQKLSPKLGGYFDILLVGAQRGSGRSAKRVILTVPDSNTDAKCPYKIAPELPQESGLLTVFNAATGKA
jgi:hypothetical protein